MVSDMLDEILNRLSNNPDFVNRKYDKFNILFFETLCDTRNINDFILKYLNCNNNIEKITNFKIVEMNNIDDVITNLYSGFVIIVNDNKFYSMEFKRALDSGINACENEKILKGPKDGFTENYQTNIGLIRKRLRTDKLRLKEFTVGTKSKTKICVMYVDDIANIDTVNKIIDRINNINIDSIMDSSYIYEYIRKNNSLFPTAINTERPDMVSYKLLNGKIAIVVENVPNVILIPIFFDEFFHTMEDYYTNTKNATYMRIIRVIAFFITIMLPSLYIALITYNHEIIPPSLLINFATQKDGVPFSTIFEAVMMNIIFEILRETDARTPSTLGSALSIVGALVLGDAAVKAGLVSPIMVIVIAITAISELVFSINDLSNATKIWRLIFIFLASISGILGVYIALILLVSCISNTNSINYPYMYPLSPFDKDDIKDDILLSLKYKMKKRNKLTAKKNTTRGEI